MPIMQPIYIEENGQETILYPETIPEQIKLDDGRDLQDMLEENLVLIFETALSGGNKPAETL